MKCRRALQFVWLGAMLVGVLAVQSSAQTLSPSIFDDTWKPASAPASPIPGTAAQKASWKLAADLFHDEIASARTSAQKLALATKLKALAADSKGDAASQYVLLTQAKDLSLSSSDPTVAFDCLDELASHFQIDYPAMKLELFSELARTINSPADFVVMVDGLNHWARVQARANRSDIAAKAVELAARAATRSRDATLIDKTKLNRTWIGEIQSATSNSKAAFTALQHNPKDPAANLAAGRLTCLFKGDWKSGLPMLAQGSDPTLKTLAVRESAANKADATPQQKAALADDWWNLSERQNGLAREEMRSHAADWYQAALPGLAGLSKLKAENRLRAVQPGTAQLATTPPAPVEPKSISIVSKVVELGGTQKLTTDRSFSPPIEFTIVARTNSTNIRIGYAASQIIFNWELNPDELRIDGGPASGRHKKGAGRIPINTWVEIKLRVLPDSMTIFVDGKERYYTEADFSKIDDRFKIWPANGSAIAIRSLSFHRLDRHGKPVATP